MKPHNKIDLGSVHVHKKVLAEVIAKSIDGIKGVSLIEENPLDKLLATFGRTSFPGVQIKIFDNSEVTLEIKVFVQYGINIPDIARQIQSVVRAAIEKTIDVQIKDINVNIQGIERSSK